MRFFDNEEVMLFSFPQSHYQDGTFISKDGKYKRLNDYDIVPLGFTEAGGHKFSLGWKVKMKDVKDEEYTIIPKMDGQLNLTYYELLADVKDKKGDSTVVFWNHKTNPAVDWGSCLENMKSKTDLASLQFCIIS